MELNDPERKRSSRPTICCDRIAQLILKAKKEIGIWLEIAGEMRNR